MSRCRHYSHLTQENVENFLFSTLLAFHKVATTARTTFLWTFSFAALQPGYFMINIRCEIKRADATATALIKIQSTHTDLSAWEDRFPFLLNQKWNSLMVVFMCLLNHSLDKSRTHILYATQSANKHLAQYLHSLH